MLNSFIESDESDRQDVRVSMGWKVNKDNKTGKTNWQVTDRKILDCKIYCFTNLK